MNSRGVPRGWCMAPGNLQDSVFSVSGSRLAIGARSEARAGVDLARGTRTRKKAVVVAGRGGRIGGDRDRGGLGAVAEAAGSPEIDALPDPAARKRGLGASGPSGAPSLGEGKWQVSKDGGRLAKWRADGKELIFLAPNGSPMAVKLTTTGTAFQAGVPEQLFALPPNLGDWDVTADGKRFLVTVPPAQQTTQTPITVVLNWEAALKR